MLVAITLQYNAYFSIVTKLVMRPRDFIRFAILIVCTPSFQYGIGPVKAAISRIAFNQPTLMVVFAVGSACKESSDPCNSVYGSI